MSPTHNTLCPPGSWCLQHVGTYTSLRPFWLRHYNSLTITVSHEDPKGPSRALRKALEEGSFGKRLGLRQGEVDAALAATA